MADPASGTPPSDNGAAIVSKHLTALLLKDEGTDDIASSFIPSTPPSSLEASYLHGNRKSTAAPNRHPLFSSVREALESSGQLKEEPGGYVIKRHSGRQQQQQQHRSAERPKNRHGKRRPNIKSDTTTTTTRNPVEDEADAAGYTVILRRSSCDETKRSSSASATTAAIAPTRQRDHRPSAPARGNKKTQQQSQRQRRGSMSALSQSSSLLASAKPPPSSSAPPGFQSCPMSHALRPSPGLPPAASGWVVKAAAPAENVKKIEEPPVEALWPEMKAISKTDSGWAVTTKMGESSLQSQAWTATSSSTDQGDDDDLLARLGVTL